MPEWKIQIDGITPSRRADRGIGTKAQVQLRVLIDQAIGSDQSGLDQVQDRQDEQRLIRRHPFSVLSDFQSN
jgi:hypothetical protein